MKEYNVIGLMSGTSLDGLDMLQVKLWRDEDSRWQYQFVKAQTLPYSEDWRRRLKQAVKMSGLELAQLHADYGHYTGQAVSAFLQQNPQTPKPDFVAVHGHTVFHQPQNKLTLQIGDGAAIAAECGLPVINNFRTGDVALGGQGAPLVPIGDMLLFGQYDFCLNLGGIANISYNGGNGLRTAFDICPCNMALNHYAARLGTAYDKDGENARKGKLIDGLLNRLSALAYYAQKPPKSLGFEWFESEFLPVVHDFEKDNSTQDILHTLVKHIAVQTAAVCADAGETGKGRKTVLLTGGGALNTYLAEQIAVQAGVEIAPVDRMLTDYKEALIFALLGVLRMENQPNCLRSVTGAARNNTGGAVYTV